MEDVIETNRDVVMSLFASELGRGPSERPHTVAALEAYLSALVRALRRRQREEPEALRIAREHGAQLARMHYDVGVLVREFVSLRTACVLSVGRSGEPQNCSAPAREESLPACDQGARSPQNSSGDPPPGVSTASGAMGSSTPGASSAAPLPER